MRVGFINIGWITDDDVERLCGERAIPVALQHGNVLDGEVLNVTRRQRNRIGHKVNGGDVAIGAFAGQRQSDSAGAGTEIENAARLAG